MQVSPYSVPTMASPSHCAVRPGSLALVVFYPDTPEMSFPCEGAGGLMPAVGSGVSPSLGSLTRAVRARKPGGRRPWADRPADYNVPKAPCHPCPSGRQLQRRGPPRAALRPSWTEGQRAGSFPPQGRQCFTQGCWSSGAQDFLPRVATHPAGERGTWQWPRGPSSARGTAGFRRPRLLRPTFK